MRERPLLTVRLRVPRAKIVEAAQVAIKNVQKSDAVPTSLVRKLMKTARTEPRFLIGDWYIDGECGCLIGNYLGGKPSHLPAGTPHRDALEDIGYEFDFELKDRLTSRQQKKTQGHVYGSADIVVAVID